MSGQTSPQLAMWLVFECVLSRIHLARGAYHGIFSGSVCGLGSLLCSLWLGGGRGHVYDIIGSRGGWDTVDIRCSSRAEGAVLGGGRSVAGVLGGA